MARTADRLRHEMRDDRRALRRDVVLTSVTGAALAIGLLAGVTGVLEARPWLYGLAYLAGGVPPALSSARALRRGKLDIDLLMVLAALAAAAVGEARDGALLLFLFSLADTLEDYAMGNTKRAVASLMTLRPDVAHRKNADGGTETVAVEELRPGEVVLVRPGERVPVDGEVVSGRSALDQSPITGESVPVDKAPGDVAFAGTVNGQGALEVRVDKRADESTLARMVELVTQAQAQKAPSQRFSDWFGQRYTVLVLGGSAAALLGFGLAGPSWSEAAYTAATLLVVASPCAVVISVPAAILSALAAGARRGILFKGGASLEALADTNAVAFDKTGTLTEGRMRLQAVRPLAGSEADALRLAAALEGQSDHPLARAVVEAARERGTGAPEATEARWLPGMGMEGTVEARAAWIGNRRLARERGVDLADGADEALDALERAGMTGILVGEGGTALAAIGIADAVRATAREAIAALRTQGFERFAMLTGDHATVARAVAERLGLDPAAVHAELLPEDKVRLVEEMSRRDRVAFVGDGVNDGAALATARVGVAMGVAGSDVALETADVALLSDDLRKLPEGYRLARRAGRIIRQNLVVALGAMVVMVVWTLVGDLPLPLGVVGHEGGTLVVVANGLRLLLSERVRASRPPPGRVELQPAGR